MAGRNPKGAALGQSHYESDDISKCFEAIVDPLLQELEQPDIQFTARDLSLLVGQMQQFQQDCLGAFNRPSTAPIRIPVKLFKVTAELSTDSPLYTILQSAYTFRLQHNWKRFDFTNPSKKQKNADLFQFVRQQLVKQNYISIPKVYIAETETDSVRKSITSLVKKLDVVLVDDKNEATHIVHGPLHRHGEGPEEDWFRTLEKKGNLVLVHWWYYPDSFDSWLPQTQQFTDPEEPPEHNGPWVINARWLQDSVRFNELMNEEDYEDNDDEEEEDEEEEEEDEMEEMEEEQVKLTTTSGKKRKLGNIPTEISTPINAPSTVTTAANSEVATPETPSFKELTSAVSAEYPGFNPAQGVFTQPPLPVHNPGHQPVVHVRDIEAERPQVGSRQRKNEFEPYANGDMLNISQYTARHVDYPKRPAKKQKMEVDDGLDIPSLIKPAPCDYDEMPLPSWYDETTISEFEKLGLPEFFDESNQDLDPQDYKLCRDYMVEKYRANPDYYLTVSACKAHLEHDLLVLVRIHSFLEHNNLINNRTDPRRRIFDPFIDSEPDSLILSESQRDFKDIEHADLEYLRRLVFDPSNVKASRSNWNIRVEDDIKADGRKVFQCYNCTTDCSQFRYQSLKSKDTNICIDCFLEGRFPATTFSGDYIRVEAGPELFELDEEWTDTEILKLLEGVDKYDDDWLLISELVSTRSKEQCITKFLQLPINDEFLTAKLSKSEKERLPFSDTPNPVMTMTSFLAGHINPGIGAAAAKEALKVLLQSGEGKESEKDENEQVKQEQDAQVKVEQDDDDGAMDVDEEPKKTPGAFSEDTIKKATEAALKSGVESTLKLASYEDQEIQHWTRLAVQTMVDKLVLKVQQYDELESSLENELKELEKQQGLLATSIESLSKQHFPLPTAVDVATEASMPMASTPLHTPSQQLATTGTPTLAPAPASMPVLAPAPVPLPAASVPVLAPAPPTNEPDKS